MLILGCDPGISSWGIALYDTISKSCRVDCLLQRSNYPAKGTENWSLDVIERGKALIGFLHHFADPCHPDVVVAEHAPPVRNGNLRAKIACMWGIMMATFSDKPLHYLLPRDIKTAVTADNKASKADMIKAIDSMYKIKWPKMTAKHEHCADAVGAIHCYMARLN